MLLAALPTALSARQAAALDSPLRLRAVDRLAAAARAAAAGSEDEAEAGRREVGVEGVPLATRKWPTEVFVWRGPRYGGLQLLWPGLAIAALAAAENVDAGWGPRPALVRVAAVTRGALLGVEGDRAALCLPLLPPPLGGVTWTRGRCAARPPLGLLAPPARVCGPCCSIAPAAAAAGTALCAPGLAAAVTTPLAVLVPAF